MALTPEKNAEIIRKALKTLLVEGGHLKITSPEAFRQKTADFAEVFGITTDEATTFIAPFYREALEEMLLTCPVVPTGPITR